MATSKERADDHLPTRFVRRLVTELLQEPRVEAFWLEGDDDSIQWPPYARLDLHLLNGAEAPGYQHRGNGAKHRRHQPPNLHRGGQSEGTCHDGQSHR